MPPENDGTGGLTSPRSHKSAHHSTALHGTDQGNSGGAEVPGQLRFSDAPGPVGAASRADDRPTSVEAARSLDPLKVSEQIADILVTIAQHPAGRITSEIAATLGRDRGCVARRITDAARRGLVRDDGVRLGPAGRNQTVWRITSAGRTVAASHLARKAAS